MIGTSIGPAAETSDFINANIDNFCLILDTLDVSASSPQEHTRTIQNKSTAFTEMFEGLLPHLRTIELDVQSEWTALDMRLLGEVLIEFEDGFSKSKIDLGYCTAIRFRIQLNPKRHRSSPDPIGLPLSFRKKSTKFSKRILEQDS